MKEQLEFQKELYHIKEEFYVFSMKTPASLEQELLVTEILKEDLDQAATAIENYINTGNTRYPSGSTISVYTDNNKPVTQAVLDYYKYKQTILRNLIDDVCDLLKIYEFMPKDIKKYYINQVFRLYVFNLDNYDDSDNPSPIVE